jgi:leader peptidase (prepilin peptidase) / N-methyltransferase
LQPELLPFWFWAGSLTVLGAIWGSFAAALCVRWPSGESIVKGRSRCDHCFAVLAPQELIPILSYCLQRGRCGHCANRIGRFSLLVELACATLGLMAAVLFSDYAAFAVALFFWLLVPLGILDWRHLWLPDSLIVVLAAAGLLLGRYVSDAPLDARLIGGVAGYSVLQLIRLFYRKFRGVDGMGGGDPKLLGAIGLWTGWQGLPVTVMLASGIGLACYLLRPQAKSIDQGRLPLGAFLAAAAGIFIAAQPVAQL